MPIKALTKNKRKGIIGMTASESFSGPIPPPQILEHYDRILPGSANRILVMAETQMSHRIRLEKNVVDSDIKKEKVGMRYAFVSLVLMMIIGVILVLMGKEAGYIALFGPALAQAINYFFVKKDIEKKIRDKNVDIQLEKKKLMTKNKTR